MRRFGFNKKKRTPQPGVIDFQPEHEYKGVIVDLFEKHGFIAICDDKGRIIPNDGKKDVFFHFAEHLPVELQNKLNNKRLRRGQKVIVKVQMGENGPVVMKATKIRAAD